MFSFYDVIMVTSHNMHKYCMSTPKWFGLWTSWVSKAIQLPTFLWGRDSHSREISSHNMYKMATRYQRKVLPQNNTKDKIWYFCIYVYASVHVLATYVYTSRHDKGQYSVTKKMLTRHLYRIISQHWVVKFISIWKHNLTFYTYISLSLTVLHYIMKWYG